MKGWILIGLLSLLLGCAQTGIPGKGAAGSPEEAPGRSAGQEAIDHDSQMTEVFALLAYYQSLAGLAPEEFRREIRQRNREFARDGQESSRLRLIVALCAPQASTQDLQRALALVEGAQSGHAAPESPRRRFLLLMQGMLSGWLQEQRRADGLQKKLDSLMAIERSLRERKP